MDFDMIPENSSHVGTKLFHPKAAGDGKSTPVSALFF